MHTLPLVFWYVRKSQLCNQLKCVFGSHAYSVLTFIHVCLGTLLSSYCVETLCGKVFLLFYVLLSHSNDIEEFLQSE